MEVSSDSDGLDILIDRALTTTAKGKHIHNSLLGTYVVHTFQKNNEFTIIIPKAENVCQNIYKTEANMSAE